MHRASYVNKEELQLNSWFVLVYFERRIVYQL